MTCRLFEGAVSKCERLTRPCHPGLDPGSTSRSAYVAKWIPARAASPLSGDDSVGEAAMHETAGDIAELERLLDESYASAGEHLKSIHYADSRLSAEEVRNRLKGVCVIDLASVSASGAPAGRRVVSARQGLVRLGGEFAAVQAHPARIEAVFIHRTVARWFQTARLLPRSKAARAPFPGPAETAGRFRRV